MFIALNIISIKEFETPMSNIREVAKIAGVSPSTVSRVLNGTSYVNKVTKERVLNAVNNMGYLLNNNKQKNNRLNFGIIVPKTAATNLPAHPTIYSIISGFIEVLLKKDASNSMLVMDEDHKSNISKLFPVLHDGYIIIGTSEEEEDKLLAFLISKDIPAIVVNRWVNEKKASYVNIDDVDAAFNATNRLIDLGHKRIAFVGGNENFRNSKLRLRGYTMAMEQHGLEILPGYVIHGQYTEEYGYNMGPSLLSISPRPTAAFFASDMIAIGLQRSIKEMGLTLPQDMAMVGFSDVNLASYVQPSLTTIRMPAEEMGAQAALALINLIENPNVKRMQIVMDSALIIRESCGAPIIL